MSKKQKRMLARILAAAVLLIALNFLPVEGGLRFACYLVPYLVIGYDILIKAGKGIRNRQVFDENFLMAVATIGAIALALYEGSGDYTEAIAVMLFYQVGEWFQSYAVGKSRRNISELMDIRPDYANVEVDGKLEQADPDEVAVGTVIVVQPGEKVPIDGVVTEGDSTLNTAALTGESLPRDVRAGDEIVSGCVNMTGVLKIKTTREFGESTVSKILDLVENASSRKSRSEDFISKFARVYTPAVCIAALALALALGVVFGVMSTSHFAVPRSIARAYVEAIQNTPLVLQAYVFYLALPYVGVMMGQVSVGIFAVGIYHGAYIAEVVRAGIQSIPRGQAEAAASQGFTYVQTMRWVILPQTVKIILPPLVNQMVNLIKNTSVIALIGGTDLMNRTNDWATSGASIYGPPFLVCGVLYFLLCFPLSTWGRRYEERLKRKDSRAGQELQKIEEELS